MATTPNPRSWDSLRASVSVQRLKLQVVLRASVGAPESRLITDGHSEEPVRLLGRGSMPVSPHRASGRL
ncbi:MAG: hypothetical protein CMJ50_09535 [Planctomycetaceae bacterium]|nr:hypothetical protein [Planctomycetaceae bacterium]